MHSLFNGVNLNDKALFKYSNMYFMENRVFDYYNRYKDDRKINTGRVESSHVLISLLSAMNVSFNGNLHEFISKSAEKALQLSRTVGLTTNYNTGKLFEGTLYPGCKEIIIQERDSELLWIDLWTNWRNVSPIKIICHPVTDLTVFELGVMNEAVLSDTDIVVYTVDMAVMNLQWQFYKAGVNNPTMESFLTEIVFPNAFQSHLDIVPFNRVMARRGLRPFCKVKTNLNFNQQAITQELDRILTTVEKNISGRRLQPNQYLSAIPTIFGDNYLLEIKLPGLMPTSQVLWALVVMRMERVNFLLDIGKTVEWAAFDGMLARLERSMAEYLSSNIFGVGLSGTERKDMLERLRVNVVEKLPFEVDGFA